MCTGFFVALFRLMYYKAFFVELVYFYEIFFYSYICILYVYLCYISSSNALFSNFFLYLYLKLNTKLISIVQPHFFVFVV